MNLNMESVIDRINTQPSIAAVNNSLEPDNARPPKPPLIKTSHIIILFAGIAIFMSFLLLSIRIQKTGEKFDQADKSLRPKNIAPTSKKAIVLEKDTPTPTLPYANVPVSDQEIIFTNKENNEIFEINPNGSGKKLLYSSKTKILDLVAAPNGKMLAFTQSSNSTESRSLSDFVMSAAIHEVFAGVANFNFPKSKLFLLDVSSLKVDELPLPEESAVQYPTWSTDSKYLSYWINAGTQSRVYDVSSKKIVLDVTSDSESEPVSPIVFLPKSTNYVAYIYAKTLRELEISGKAKTTYGQGFAATRAVHEGPALPNPPVYSNDEMYVALYKENGDLVVMDKESLTERALVKGIKGEIFDIMPAGYIVGFNLENNLVYEALKDGSYQANDVMPLFVYSWKDDRSVDFNTSAKNIDIGSMMFTKSKDRIITHSFYSDTGIVVYDGNGKIIRDCGKYNFRYPYYSWGGGPDYTSISKILANKEQVILSDSADSIKIFDIYQCQEIEILKEPFSKAIWVNIADK